MAINSVASSTSPSIQATRPQVQPDQPQQAKPIKRVNLAADAETKTPAQPKALQAEAPRPVVNTLGHKIGTRINTMA